MTIGKYRITTPTLALFLEGSLQVARTVPAGAVITVDTLAVNKDKLLEVTWDDQKVMMFAQDLSTRGEVIGDLAAKR